MRSRSCSKFSLLKGWQSDAVVVMALVKAIELGVDRFLKASMCARAPFSIMAMLKSKLLVSHATSFKSSTYERKGSENVLSIGFSI